MMMFHVMPDQTFTLKQTWCLYSQVVWWLSHAQMWLLYALSAPLCIKCTLSVHRSLCKRAHWWHLMSQSFTDLHPKRTVIWKQVCVSQVVVWMPLIITKYSEDHCFDCSSSCAIPWERLYSSHSMAAIMTSLLHGVFSSSDNLIPSSAEMKRQAGQKGSTVHAAPTVFSPFQKHNLITQSTLQCRLSTVVNWSVKHF
jgi:hypothetical protein